MYILMVRLQVKPDRVGDFIEASKGDGIGSVRDEPGCMRFDIIQDDNDPTLFAFCEVYNDEAAFQHHTTTPHFAKWRDASVDMFAAETEVSFCRPVYPRGDAKWDAQRPGAVDDAHFANGTLHVIHAPQYVQEDKVDEFIAAVTLDGIGSTHEEPGCLRFDVYQNINDPTELYLYEVYANRDAFDYHVAHRTLPFGEKPSQIGTTSRAKVKAAGAVAMCGRPTTGTGHPANREFSRNQPAS